jgi:large subunit ribosomal protein L2
MPLKKYKPMSAGQRGKLVSDYTELKTDEPERKRKERRQSVRNLHKAISKHVGRNNQGRVTSRFRGGGSKKIYREIDFLRSDKAGISGRIDFFTYDPNRNCWIALVVYRDGEKRYILAPVTLKVGDTVVSGSDAAIRDGNALPLSSIPLGSQVHNVEMSPGKGGQLARSAGQYAQLLAKEKGMAAIKLPSGESRWVLDRCYATLGQLSNSEYSNQGSAKAGRTRHKGRKPHVRGVVMNPVDHKHGGGEGRCPVGAAGPYTAFGKKQGVKTRSKRKNSSKFIIQGRKKRK